jgi:glycerol uptake facilitator-like aquaporin
VANLFIVLTAGTGAGAFNLGCMTIALHAAFGSNCQFNPAVDFGNSRSFGGALSWVYMIVGAAIGTYLANQGGVAAGAAQSAGFNVNGFVAELLAVVLLQKVGGSGVNEGFAYYALLTTFGGAAGSIFNPATSVGLWLGNAINGGGLALGADALTGLAVHLVATFGGAFLSKEVFANADKISLDKAGLDNNEFWGSFWAIFFAAGGSDPFFYGLALMVTYSLYNADIFPAVSAANAFGKGADAVGFVKKLVAQTLGAVVARFVAGWVVGSNGAPAAGSINDSIIQSILFGFVFVTFVAASANFFHRGLVYMVSAFFFAATNFNSAATLAAALTSGTAGLVASVSSTAWLAAFFGPVIGGIVAARLASVF